VVNIQNTPTLATTTQPTVQPSGTPTPVLLAPSIIGQTPTVGTPSTNQPQVLIPVTGADLSGKHNQQQIVVSRAHQLQSGMNLLGFGLILIGLMLMGGRKED
jgi:hypothetical protein